MKFLAQIRQYMSTPEIPTRAVSFDCEGFKVVVGDKPGKPVLWADVREVAGFKQDYWSFDEICLGFRVEGSDNYVWSGEQDNGFVHFRAEVERRFNLDPSWFWDIMVPAFEEKWTSLWPRP